MDVLVYEGIDEDLHNLTLVQGIPNKNKNEHYLLFEVFITKVKINIII